MEIKQRKIKTTLGILFLAGVWGFSSAPAWTSSQGFIGNALRDNKVHYVTRIPREALAIPELDKFKADLTQLVERQEGPFACFNEVRKQEGALTVIPPLAENLHTALVQAFEDQLSSLMQLRFADFGKAVGEILTQEDYRCLQDTGRLTFRFQDQDTDWKVHFEGEAFSGVMDLAHEIFPVRPWLKVTTTTGGRIMEEDIPASTQGEIPGKTGFEALPGNPAGPVANGGDKVGTHPSVETASGVSGENSAATGSTAPAMGVLGGGCSLQATGVSPSHAQIALTLGILTLGFLRRGHGTRRK